MRDTETSRLPEIDPAATPEFSDGASCKAWLENVPLANVSTSQYQLLIQAEEFNRYAAAPKDRFEALEAAREAVGFVQIEQAKRFTNRALPMLESEAAVFEDTIELWEQMRLGYLRCLEADDSSLRAQRALICQRALAYSGLRMFHHYRAYRQVPGRDWRALHQAYARAEALGIADEPVKDYLNRDVHDTSPRIAYMRALLLGMCNPNELGPRQLTFVAYLLERWADKVEISAKPPAREGELLPLAVDLAGDRCAERGVADGKAVRILDEHRLAKSLRNRVALLRKGESPAKLALGEDCVQPSCEALLVFLYRQWCQARPPRGAERVRVMDVAQCCTDIAAIHYYISGRVFRGASEFKELTTRQRDEIATFGRVSTRDEEDFSVAQGFLLEHWHLEDESAQGLKMVRRAGNPGKRMAHGQLVGVRPADGKNFQLGQVRWLMSTNAGDLYCGVKLLPGVPIAAAVRAIGVNVAEERYVQAFALAAVPALQAPPTLVTAAGWFKPKRVLEVAIHKPLRVRLLEVVERGTDFERLSYEVLPD
jgi:cyclic-di-GMP-binding protein